MALLLESAKRRVDGAVRNIRQAQLVDATNELVPVRFALREQPEKNERQHTLEELTVVARRHLHWWFYRHVLVNVKYLAISPTILPTARTVGGAVLNDRLWHRRYREVWQETVIALRGVTLRRGLRAAARPVGLPATGSCTTLGNRNSGSGFS